MSKSFIFQVDHLALHPNGLFCFGWMLVPQASIASAQLLLRLSDGSGRRVHVNGHRAREDVGLAFPHHPSAATSGFLAIAGWSAGSLSAATMEFHTDGGQCISVDLKLPAPGTTAKSRSLRYLVGRALAYVRLGRIDIIWKKLRMQRARDLVPLPEPRADTLARRISGTTCRLLIDHEMGGGANIYREGRVEQWLAAGDTVIQLGFRLETMSLRLRVRKTGSETEHALQCLDDLLAPLREVQLREIFVNCAVSFPQPARLQAFILALLEASETELTVAMHEYFMVCPSHFLLDAEGKYCGIPEPQSCAQCLAQHTDGFVSLADVRSIKQWRCMWGKLLAASDRILCFSDSSRGLLARAYPQLGDRVVLQPHTVPAIRRVRFHRRTAGTLTVGIVGAISEHKGALVVEDLMRAVRATNADVRLVVIGTIAGIRTSSGMTVTGPYEREQLPDLIGRHQVDIALFPSICPETFSYTAHEILAAGLPLISFDLGAQGDLVRSHAAGHIASRMDGAGLLAEILTFARRTNTRLEEVIL